MIMNGGGRIVARVPVVRSRYSWTKQLLETVLSQTSTAFREVVLIEYPRRGCWAVGFITGETVGEVQRLTEATVYRSEEHTSELQSLMRISYAVFCLKKKKQKSANRKRTHLNTGNYRSD